MAQPLEGDGRIVTVDYREGRVIPLRASAGNSMALLFAPGEQLLSVEVGDPVAFEVSLSGSADSLFIKTSRTPANPLLRVRSNLRSYDFRVEVGPPNLAQYVVRFSYADAVPAPPPQPAQAAAPAQIGTYRLSGKRSLRPLRISDDGVRTYIEWDENLPLPAVFAIGPDKEEEMVDSYMRDKVFTIDRVYGQLVFRYGKLMTKATRTER